MRLQRDSYAPKSCAFDAANVQFLRAHLCKSHPVLQHLRALYAPGAVGQRLRKAIRWLRDNFREPITIEQLSSVADMAPTTFHRHFKAFTSFSPLQYQKRLRLYEAQQFLLRGDGDVNSAAYAVGYQSPQQFNRDYKTLFGTTPGKSIKAQRGAIYTAVGDDNFSPHSEYS